MLRYVTLALPLLILLLALFGFVVGALDLEPGHGSVVRLAVLEQPAIPGQVVLTVWLMEACGLLALYLLAQGRCGAWWLDGLVAGWLGWVFRGPIFVLTVVVATRQNQDEWWRLGFAWWILYTLCGLALAILAKRQGLVGKPRRERTIRRDRAEEQIRPATAEPQIDARLADAPDEEIDRAEEPEDAIDEPSDEASDTDER